MIRHALIFVLVIAAQVSAADVVAGPNEYDVTRKQFEGLPDFETQKQVDLAIGSWTCKMFSPAGKVVEIYNLQTITMHHTAQIADMGLKSTDDTGTANVVALLNLDDDVAVCLDPGKALSSHVGRFKQSFANRGELRSTEGKELLTRNFQMLKQKEEFSLFDRRNFVLRQSEKNFRNINFVRLDEQQHQLVIETNISDFYDAGFEKSIISPHFSTIAYSLCEMPML